MPAYNTLAIPPALLIGGQATLWNNETPPAGAASERVAVQGSRDGLSSFVRIELKFAAAPGGYQVDIQTADTDDNSYFVTQTGTSMTGANATNAASYKYEFLGKFLRLIMTTPAGAAITAKITRGG